MATTIQLPFPGLTAPPDRWIAPEHAPHVDAFSGFLKSAREIADDVGAPAEERKSRLKALGAGLDGAGNGPACAALRDACTQTGASLEHARHVLQACEKDLTASSYRSWSELLTYCRYAAAPAGRFVFELHGEDERAKKCADSLFSAWQVLHIIQGCKDEFAVRGRVYLPAMWMRQNDVAAEDLGKNRASAQARKVLAQCLDGVQRLIDSAASQTECIREDSLRDGARASLGMADRLSQKLLRRDPLARDIDLTGWDRLVVRVRGRAR